MKVYHRLGRATKGESRVSFSDMIPQLLPLKEVRRILGISRVTMWKWTKQGKISVVKLSARKVCVRREELERFIHDNEIGQIPGVAGKMPAQEIIRSKPGTR